MYELFITLVNICIVVDSVFIFTFLPLIKIKIIYTYINDNIRCKYLYTHNSIKVIIR